MWPVYSHSTILLLPDQQPLDISVSPQACNVTRTIPQFSHHSPSFTYIQTNHYQYLTSVFRPFSPTFRLSSPHSINFTKRLSDIILFPRHPRSITHHAHCVTTLHKFCTSMFGFQYSLPSIASAISPFPSCCISLPRTPPPWTSLLGKENCK